jgi:outer membrane murein-binding lipoprotein Lpp
LTKAQEIHDEVNRLMKEGVERADAFRQIADRLGIKFDSARGAYYSHRKAIGQSGGGSPRRTRKRETTPEDAVASAVATLRAAIDSIEIEVETARERAEEAQAEYEAMRAASSGRIEEIRAKVAVLDPDGSAEASADQKEADKPAKPTPRKEGKGS